MAMTHTKLKCVTRLLQSAQETTAAAAAAAVVREATATAVQEVLDTGVSAEEKSMRLAAIKEEKMRKVIRWAYIIFEAQLRA